MNNELAPTRRTNWLPTEAHIFAVFEVPKSEFKTAHHTVSYSYTVNGELQVGDFIDYTTTTPYPLNRGDKLPILYNPGNPSQSKVPRHNSFGWKQIAAVVMGSLLLLAKFGLHGVFGLLYRLLHH